MVLLYTKFQLSRAYTVGGVIWKRKSLQTDRRTDAKGYNILRPFFKRVYNNKKKKKEPISFIPRGLLASQLDTDAWTKTGLERVVERAEIIYVTEWYWENTAAGEATKGDMHPYQKGNK